VALAVLLLLAQSLALIHLGTVSHLIDLATGRVVHATAELPDDAPASPAPASQHEPCAVYAALTQSATGASCESTVLLVLSSGTDVVMPPGHETVPCRRELHRLSPAHSPPAAA
jgi:hypothetical protein